MELRHATAPYFRQRESIQSIGLSRLAAAAALLVPALFVYGLRALFMALSGVAGAVAVEALWQFVRRREQSLGDLSAVYTGLLCALLLPAAAPLWLPFAAGAFAAGAVKLPFGGLGRSPFCAAAGGYCFAAMLGAHLPDHYNSALLSAEQQRIYSLVPERCFVCREGTLPLLADVPVTADITGSVSTAMQLRAGIDPGLNLWGLLFTGGSGPMGGAVAVLALVCAGWLLLRRVFAWQSAAVYALTAAVLSLVWPWQVRPYILNPVYELFGGGVLLCAVFVAGDILTAPHTGSGRALYGLCAGVLTVIFRRTGSSEGGEIFALLLMNAAASPMDHFVFWCRARGISLAAYRRRITSALRRKFGSRNRFDIDVDELYEELEREKKEKRRQQQQLHQQQQQRQEGGRDR